MQRSITRYTANQATTPVRIVSDTVPQFQMVQASSTSNSMFNISTGSTGTTISGTSLVIQNADFTTARIGRIRQTRQVTNYTGIGASKTLTASDLGNIVTLSASPDASEEFTLNLPTATALISGLTMAKDDVLTFDIINETDRRANVMLLGVPVDTIEPVNDMGSGSIIINAHSSAIITIYIATVVPPVAQYYIASNSGLRTALTLPVTGVPTSLYCAADTNVAYRYGTITTNYYDWTVGAGGDFATLPLAIASPLVVSGQALCLLDGTYNLAAQLVISKSLTIFGQSRTGTILRCLAATELGNLISVTAENVVLCNMTIGHYKTTNVATDSAIDLPADVAGFIMDSCTCIYEETAVIVRSHDWKINNNTFVYGGPINGVVYNTIIIDTSDDDAFITNNIFDNLALVTGTAVAILAETGVVDGTISIEDNTHTGLLAQLLAVTTFSGTALSICAKRNTVTETDAFISFANAVAGFGDALTQVVAEDNVLTNAHETGIFIVFGAGGIAFRTVGNLPVHVDGNTLGTETIAAGCAAATGSSHASFNYDTVSIAPAVVVTQDAIIPVTPTPPVTPTETTTTARYIPVTVPFVKDTRVLGAGDLVYIDLSNIARPHSIVAFRNRDALTESVDYAVTVTPHVTRMIWLAGLVLIAGDRITVQYILA